LITDLFGWRAAFASFAALTMFCALGMAALLPRDPARPPSGWIGAFRGMTAHLRNPRLAGAYVIGSALFSGFIGVFT
jgi:predicted MFS family arabinose efflux permease